MFEFVSKVIVVGNEQHWEGTEVKVSIEQRRIRTTHTLTNSYKHTNSRMCCIAQVVLNSITHTAFAAQVYTHSCKTQLLKHEVSIKSETYCKLLF